MLETTFSEVNHFPRVLKHFDDKTLVKTTLHYVWRAYGGPEGTGKDYVDRAELCKAECRRRGIASSLGSTFGNQVGQAA